jgi:hypothetical protein
MKIRAIFIINVFLSIALIMTIFRDVTLSRLDCEVCRRFFSFIAQPEDYNKPIGMVAANGQTSVLFLFPKYVGWYSLSLYERKLESSELNEVKITAIDCHPALKYKILNSESKFREVYSQYGDGITLGLLFTGPAEVRGSKFVRCKIDFDSKQSGNLVASRMSEL